jgi:hypothetical protein
VKLRYADTQVGYVGGFITLVTEVRNFHTLGQNHIYFIQIQPFSTLSSPGNGLHRLGTVVTVGSKFELRDLTGM